MVCFVEWWFGVWGFVLVWVFFVPLICEESQEEFLRGSEGETMVDEKEGVFLSR